MQFNSRFDVELNETNVPIANSLGQLVRCGVVFVTHLPAGVLLHEDTFQHLQYTPGYSTSADSFRDLGSHKSETVVVSCEKKLSGASSWLLDFHLLRYVVLPR